MKVWRSQNVDLIQGQLSFAELSLGELALFIPALVFGITLVGVCRGPGRAKLLLGEFTAIATALALGIQLVGIRKSCAGERQAAGGDNQQHLLHVSTPHS